jgi:hypothetical protein
MRGGWVRTSMVRARQRCASWVVCVSSATSSECGRGLFATTIEEEDREKLVVLCLGHQARRCSRAMRPAAARPCP